MQLCTKRKFVTIDDHRQVPINDKSLEDAVRRQPIAVGLRIPKADVERLFCYQPDREVNNSI
jgi:hypothetical protein